MGAEQFTVVVSGKSADEAFRSAVDEAQYECGHGGYTGSIAEKDGYTMLPKPLLAEALGLSTYIEAILSNDIDRLPMSLQAQAQDAFEAVDDKWGPCGCIDLGEGKFVFFGWASS